MSEYLQQLNEAQCDAVVQTEGPVMIIAGAGSGKTRVLTFRIAHLLNKGVDAFEILALTFTNKAAREMKERINKVAGTEAKNLWMGTFHSVFAKILRIEADKIGFPTNFTIYDSDDSKSLMRDILKEQSLDDKTYKPSVVLNRISSAKNNLYNWQQYAHNPEVLSEDKSTGRPLTATLFEMYSKRCFNASAMDFDDILYYTWKLFQEHPDVLYKYQHKFKYIMVDEFQDTNYVQYVIVRKLSAQHENICVVGDDAQSIYAFRGANIQNILNFEKDYPELRTFKLEQNYRSTKMIVQAANSIIAKNKNQLKKDVWTDNHYGEKIKVIKSLSDNEEGNMVANSIFQEKMNHQLHNKDFAILYRTNAQSRSMEEALRRLNIPYRVYGGTSFYNRKEIKDLLAYFRLAINPSDEEAVKRIINYPTRGIGKTTLDKLVSTAVNEGKSLWEILCNVETGTTQLNSGTRDKISAFATMVKSWQIMLPTYNAYDLAHHIAGACGLLTELYADRTPEGISHYENVQELLNGIKEFCDSGEVPLEVPSAEIAQNGIRTLDLYLQDIALLTDADNDKDDDDNKVMLMTIHSAKGLEFMNVFVVGMEEALFPSQLALNSRTELEEERRLFYVAVTRAERKLTLSYAVSRYKWGNLINSAPSRFLEEIDEECLEIINTVPKARTYDDDDTRSSWGGGNNFGMKQRFTNQNGIQKKTEAPKSTTPPKPSGIPAGFKKVTNAQPASSGGNSDFVADEPSKIQVGMNVNHQRFGNGQIISIEGRFPESKAIILFEKEGQKQLLLKFAKLKILN
jgi:DNA helicase-2/ATP-dependent DNA helicase PcrA